MLSHSFRGEDFKSFNPTETRIANGGNVFRQIKKKWGIFVEDITHIIFANQKQNLPIKAVFFAESRSRPKEEFMEKTSQISFLQSLVQISWAVSEVIIKMWKVYRQTTDVWWWQQVPWSFESDEIKKKNKQKPPDILAIVLSVLLYKDAD